MARQYHCSLVEPKVSKAPYMLFWKMGWWSSHSFRNKTRSLMHAKMCSSSLIYLPNLSFLGFLEFSQINFQKPSHLLLIEMFFSTVQSMGRFWLLRPEVNAEYIKVWALMRTTIVHLNIQWEKFYNFRLMFI